MRWVADRSGRFAQRPYWIANELDAQCESLVTDFLVRRHGKADFPISTEDLTVLIEEATEDLDTFADLSTLGQDVEGATDFFEGRRPRVRIDGRLASDPRRTNRLRTTLTHEYGHVRLHGFLWDFSPAETLFDDSREPRRTACRTETIVVAPTADWMEWQAAYASGSLLMPATLIAEVVGRFQREAGRVGHVQMATDAAASVVRLIQDRFDVSEDASRVRLTKLGHLSSEAQPERGLFEPAM